MKAHINRISDRLTLITLPPPLTGFDDFISVWLVTGHINYIVDVGPAATTSALLDAIKHLQIQQLDYILLTHIHIDHSGAIGDIAAHYPETPIICHPKAISHLRDPLKLWQGSVKTLGDTARAYGPIKPVIDNPVISTEQFKNDSIRSLNTPGHSPHHVSFFTPEGLFVGEAGGVSLPVASGQPYLRPATPPKFFMEINLKSLDTLMAETPEVICYGHYGTARNGLERLVQHRNQLFMWKDIIKNELIKATAELDISACLDRLLAEDPFLAGFSELHADIQQRERFFMQNSIKGFVGYLQTLADNS